jgi:hypothetical protein
MYRTDFNSLVLGLASTNSLYHYVRTSPSFDISSDKDFRSGASVRVPVISVSGLTPMDRMLGSRSFSPAGREALEWWVVLDFQCTYLFLVGRVAALICGPG